MKGIGSMTWIMYNHGERVCFSVIFLNVAFTFLFTNVLYLQKDLPWVIATQVVQADFSLLLFWLP